MAIGPAPQRPGPLACTIYIWPSQELLAQSWRWPTHWHDAFARARGLLGLAAAMCILEGRAFDEHDAHLSQAVGGMEFVVVGKGDSVYITIVHFEGPGPHSPGPNGGTRQPTPADGLVLGLRGANRCYRLVVFHGFMPPIPATHSRRNAISLLRSDKLNSISANIDALLFSIHGSRIRNKAKETIVPADQERSCNGGAWPASAGEICRSAAMEPCLAGEEWVQSQLSAALHFSREFMEARNPNRQLLSWPMLRYWQCSSSQEPTRIWLQLDCKRYYSSLSAGKRQLH